MTPAGDTIIGDPGRLATLRGLGILDTLPEAGFDRLTRLAALLLKAPIALVSLVESERQFFKSALGLAEPWATAREAPLSHSFCRYVVATGAPLIVEDARDNMLAAGNPAMREMGIIAYLGSPLRTADGQIVGCLCVCDTQRRQWQPDQVTLLQELAALVMTEIELHSAELRQQQAMEAQALRAEAQLRESEERLQFVLEASQIGYWDLDVLRNTTERSLLHDQAFGYGALLPEWSYDTFLAHVHPLDRERVSRSFQEGATVTGVYNEEFRTVWTDGSLHWLVTIGRFVRDTEGKTVRVGGVVMDITARKQPQEALQALAKQADRQARMFNTMLSSITDLMYTFDQAGRFTYVNQAALDSWGFTLDDVIGKTFSDMGAPDSMAARLGQQIQQVFATDERVVDEMPYVSVTPSAAAGYYEYILQPVFAADGTVESVVGSARDVTERKRVETALRASEARYRTLVDHFPNGAVFLFDQELRYVVAGGTGLAASGLSPSVVEGKTIWDLFPPEIAARDEPILQAALRGVVTRVEVPFGEQVFMVHTLPVTDSQDVIVGGLIVTQNITDQKQAEAARLGRETAERANAAKSEFLSRMSHELRTPLNSILGFGQLLELEALSPEQQEHVAQILKGGRHLLGLINEVLDITGVESGQLAITREPIRVGDLVEQALALVVPLAAQQQVRINAVRDRQYDRYILADQQRLTQVLLNLLANAIKYNRQGGMVEVHCTNAGLERMRIAVRDTGVGIRTEHIPRLFAAFDRLDADRNGIEGSGLGLVLSKGLTEAMGGSMGVDSVFGVGSTFWVELPAVPAIEQAGGGVAAVAYPPGAEPVPHGHCTILYIEDNIANYRLVERIFQRRPQITLLSALRGLAGLELAHEHHPDLILLDLHLPDVLGSEVLRRLLADAVTRATPVIMLSADANARQREELLAAGACEYVTKPLDVAKFLELIDKTLATLVQKDP